MFVKIILKIFHFPAGDIFVSYAKKREPSLKVVSSPGSDPVTVSGTSLTEFALIPLTEKGDKTDILRCEGLYDSVTEFLETTKCHSLPMPAVSAVNIACSVCVSK